MRAAQHEQEADGADSEMPSLDLLQVLHCAEAHVTLQECYLHQGHEHSTTPMWMRQLRATTLVVLCLRLVSLILAEPPTDH